jgi:hypothetical protein
MSLESGLYLWIRHVIIHSEYPVLFSRLYFEG